MVAFQTSNEIIIDPEVEERTKYNEDITNNEEEENLSDSYEQEYDEISKLLAENRSSKHEAWRKKLTATLAVMCVFLGKLNVSMVMPIFPKIAIPKEIGPGKQSFVFIVPDIVGTVVMIFWGKVMPLLGLKFTLVMGVVSMGVVQCLFGMLEFLPAGNSFYISALIIRIFEGVAISAVSVTSSTTLMLLYPEKSGLMLSVIDGAGTLGYSAGPLFGGFFYEMCGFAWSFIAIGFLALILGLISGLVLVQTQYSQEEKSTNWFTYLRYYKVIFSCVLIINSFGAAMYFENIMPLYLEHFGMSPIQYGAYMIGFELIFASTTILWSYLAEKAKCIPFIVIFGLFATGILLFFLGPATFLHLPPNSVGPVLGIYWIYAGTCTTFSTQYVSMNSYLADVGLPTNLATKSMVSSVTLFALAIGPITALPLSGYLYELYGFVVTATTLGYIQTLVAFIFLIYYVIHCIFKK